MYKIIAIIDLCISIFFVFEVALRMYAMTPKWYFSKRYWFNSLDFVIVVIGFLGSLVEIILIHTKCAEGKVRMGLNPYKGDLCLNVVLGIQILVI